MSEATIHERNINTAQCKICGQVHDRMRPCPYCELRRIKPELALLSRKVEVLETGGHEVLKTAIRAQRERDELKAEVEKQKAVNEVLREGLEYYSEPLNWVCAECVYKSHHGSDHPNGNRNEYLLRGTGDNGHTIAQRALEAVRDETNG